MAKKRTCYTCGNKYAYCPHCGVDSTKPKWMVMFDCEECRDVFKILSDYSMKYATVSDVKSVIDKYNIKDTSKYKDAIKKQIDDILSLDKKPAKKANKKTVIESIEDVEIFNTEIMNEN